MSTKQQGTATEESIQRQLERFGGSDIVVESTAADTKKHFADLQLRINGALIAVECKDYSSTVANAMFQDFVDRVTQNDIDGGSLCRNVPKLQALPLTKTTFGLRSRATMEKRYLRFRTHKTKVQRQDIDTYYHVFGPTLPIEKLPQITATLMMLYGKRMQSMV